MEGGAADASGMLQVSDVLIGCGFANSSENDVEGEWYDNIIDAMSGSPDSQVIQLAFERVQLEVGPDGTCVPRPLPHRVHMLAASSTHPPPHPGVRHVPTHAQ